MSAPPLGRPYAQVDVFTDQAGLGNPLAVVLDAQGLSDAQMQRFARWTNLSETTFVLPPTAPEADYRLRIFTPGGELPFAGHPTLGSGHAWLQAGGQPRDAACLRQQCGVGLVAIRRDGAQLAFAAPPLRRQAPEPARLAAVVAALGLQPGQLLRAQQLDNGPVWLGLLLDSPQTVRQLAPDHGQLKRLGAKVGVVAIHPDAGAADAPWCEVRAFAAPIGVAEDPVTGSLNASLAQWLMAEGLAPARYVAAQGQALGRAGRVAIARDDQAQVWVGGHSVTVIEGRVHL